MKTPLILSAGALVMLAAPGCEVGGRRDPDGTPPHLERREGPRETPAPPPSPDRVIREGGWEIPGADDATVESPRRRYQPPGGEAADAYVTVLNPRKWVTTEALGLSAGERSYLRIGADNEFLISSINQYEAGGRTFCYLLEVVYMSRDRGGPLVTVGKKTWIRVFDEDGDGRFESLQWGRTEPYLPRWALAR